MKTKDKIEVRLHLNDIYYNTSTSVLIHEYDNNTDLFETQELYCSNKNNFFIVTRKEKFFNGQTGEWDYKDNLSPLSIVAVNKWILKYCPDKMDENFSSKTTTTVSIRMPDRLKIFYQTQADKHSWSLNKTIIKILEKEMLTIK